MKTTFRFALAAAALGLLPAVATAEVDCLELAENVKTAATAKPSEVLALVEKEIAANPDCACEVVKAAIQGSGADAKVVARIVEVASSLVPDKMRLISQCAVAVAPEALPEVQAVLALLDPNRGESTYSAKSSSKSAKGIVEPTPPAWNPLDFPGTGIGPTPGTQPTPGQPPVPPILNPEFPPDDTVIDGYEDWDGDYEGGLYPAL